MSKHDLNNLPWSQKAPGESKIVDATGWHVAEFAWPRDAILALTCVNACAGVKNPAALPALVESIRAWWKEHEYDTTAYSDGEFTDEYNTYDTPPPFIAALAAATGEPDHDK